MFITFAYHFSAVIAALVFIVFEYLVSAVIAAL